MYQSIDGIITSQERRIDYEPVFYQMMEQVFHEVVFLVKEEKEMVWEMVRHVCERTSQNTSSMLADVRSNRQTEIGAIVGYVLEEAKKQQRFVPTLQFCSMQ